MLKEFPSQQGKSFRLDREIDSDLRLVWTQVKILWSVWGKVSGLPFDLGLRREEDKMKLDSKTGDQDERSLFTLFWSTLSRGRHLTVSTCSGIVGVSLFTGNDHTSPPQSHQEDNPKSKSSLVKVKMERSLNYCLWPRTWLNWVVRKLRGVRTDRRWGPNLLWIYRVRGNQRPRNSWFLHWKGTRLPRGLGRTSRKFSSVSEIEYRRSHPRTQNLLSKLLGIVV